MKEKLEKLDKLTEKNSVKILNAFIENKVSESHFYQSTGYGYGNVGRGVLNKVFAQVMGAESAFVSENFVSGTHAISTSIFSVVRPKNTILFSTGTPYDTLDKLISGNDCCSLKDLDVNVVISDYLKENEFLKELEKRPEVVYIQRSRGYTLRRSLSIKDIKFLIEKIRNISKNSIIIVDNCYGEFVDDCEPTQVGADLIVGSLIKNPGAGIAVSGGYICGKKEYIDLCEQRFLSPGLHDIGSSFHNRELFMGLFYSPLAVRESLKTAYYISESFYNLGFEVFPKPYEHWNDIITSINLESEENLRKFCQIIQNFSPVDSFLTPEPWRMPGYNHDVIMSSGGFISGSSIELSCDAPVKPPFTVYIQGGTNFYLSKYAIDKILENIKKYKV